MIRIRRLEVGEGALLRQLRLAALAESPDAFCTSHASAAARSMESWEAQAAAAATGPEVCTLVAFASDEPIGIATLERVDESTSDGELLQVWVAPAQRGSTVATDLIESLLRWAGEHGFQRVQATLTAGNERARRFYRRLGFHFERHVAPDEAGDQVLVRVLDGDGDGVE